MEQSCQLKKNKGHDEKMASEQQLTITLGQISLPLEGETKESVFTRFAASLFTAVRERPCKLAPLSVVVLRSSVLQDMALRFVSQSTFTPEEIATSSQLELALESLLRSMK